MGVFDSVFLTCKHCGHVHELQSKGADTPRLLKFRDERKVPTEIAAYIMGQVVRCPAPCGRAYKVHVRSHVKVKLKYLIGDDDEGGD